ncbi:hypothetical protein KOI35_32935 [Actinoplanes bogorensis]|uniref:Uncharacterized protein n=1 Tax=Paractinoplanes bogorensis TaxID=1610840 RepID=A0ABS5Z033_9ACTN|nr:type VII secretion target [Actinoplanes bogorensis]MBU2668329.1 hypothetical protein [Actinoplanes bogorensis]
MSDVYIDSEGVRRHASMVDEAGRMCDEATAGAQYIDLHDEVYGILCSPLVLPLVQPLQDWAISELKNGADATAHVAELLRAVAADADTTDGNAARMIKESGS